MFNKNYFNKRIILFAVIGFIFFGLLPAIAAVIINSSQTNSLTSGLVLMQSFDGNHMDWSQTSAEARDQSTSGNHGDVVGATAAIGKIGQGLSFDGVNDEVTFGSSGMTLNGNIQTITAWINVNSSIVADRPGIIYIGDGNSGMRIGYANGSGEQQFFTQNNGTGSWDVTNTGVRWNGTPNMSTWVHVVTIFDWSAKTTKFYFNGINQNSPGTTPVVNAVTNTINFGRRAGSSVWFKGSIDDVRVYNRALSADEVTRLYRLGATTINRSTTDFLTSGLVLMQSFDGNHMDWSQTSAEARDQSTSGNHGDVVGATAAIGKIGQGLSFDGTSDVASLSSILPLITEFTVSSWVKVDDLAAVRGIFTSKNNSNAGFRYRIDTTGFVRFLMGNATTLDSLTMTTGALTAGRFYHITVTGKSADFMKIYVDGVLVKEKTTTQVLDYVPNAVGYIGSSWNTSSELMKGVVDDVRLYNRALTADEVARLYRLGATTINRSTTDFLTSGLVLMQSFDGNNMDWSQSTAEARDQSTSGNHGDVIGATAAIGKIGQGLEFDGTDDYVTTATTNVPLSGTVSFWYKFDTAARTETAIHYGDGWYSSSMVIFRRYNTDDKIHFGIYSGGVDQNDINNFTTSVLSPNIWYHLVSTFETNNVKLYLNGVLQKTDTLATMPTTAGTEFRIARGNFGGAPTYMDGSIDDVRLYNRALSADEVRLLYNLGR